MGKREVTERDFRMPEFMDAKVEDYEFRNDGKLVRKDRWERGIQTIRSLVGLNQREFEISEVVDAVRALVADAEGWLAIAHMDPEDYPPRNQAVSLQLADGSVLKNAEYSPTDKVWLWSGAAFSAPQVVAWREQAPEVGSA